MDLSAETFRTLVDQELAELSAPPLFQQAASFGLTVERRKRLDADRRKRPQAVVRVSDEAFNLDATLARFDKLWEKDS